MRNKTQTTIEEHIAFLNAIQEVVELFRRKDPILAKYQKSYTIGEHKIYISLGISKKYNDCLDLTLTDFISNFDKNPINYPTLSFEEVRFDKVLRTLMYALVNIYKFEDFKDTLTALKNNDKEKTFYVEK